MAGADVASQSKVLPDQGLPMNWAAVSAIGEIIGAVAVIVSLIYVGIQIKENSRAVRSAMANETTAAISSWYSAIGNCQQSTRTFYVGLTRPEELQKEDLAQFFYLGHGLLLEYQAAYYISREGTLDLALQESITKTVYGTAHLPGFRMLWRQRRDLFHPEFRKHIDEIINTGPIESASRELYESPEER